MESSLTFSSVFLRMTNLPHVYSSAVRSDLADTDLPQGNKYNVTKQCVVKLSANPRYLCNLDWIKFLVL